MVRTKSGLKEIVSTNYHSKLRRLVLDGKMITDLPDGVFAYRTKKFTAYIIKYEDKYWVV